METTNQKSTIDTQKREMNANVTLKIVSKSQAKWTKEERSAQENYKNNPKTMNKMPMYVSTNN